MQALPRSRPLHRDIRVASFVALVLAAAASLQLRADEPIACAPQIRSQDEVWLVSCRSLGCESIEKQTAQLQYWHYDRKRSWVSASLSELVATDDPGVAAILFAHGNRIEYNEAFTKGWIAYRTVVTGADERPVRFIIFSWPSEPVAGLVNDARTKAWRTGAAGYHMAWLVDQFNPDAPVALWGHSFGARVATGALHLLGGGSLDGHRLDHRVHATRRAMEVVLFAAALDNDWLMSNHDHGRAMSQVGGMLLVNNSCDSLLMRYHRLYGRRSCEEALGYTGLGSGQLTSADWNKVSQFDACCTVGRQHWFDLYIGSPEIVNRMRPYLLFTRGKPSPTPQPQTPTVSIEADTAQTAGP